MSEYIDQKRKEALKSYTIGIPLIFAASVVCIILGTVFSDKFVHSGMIFSIGVGLIFADFVVLAKFLYWNKNKKAHENLLQEEKIRFSDERKIMIRQKSGQAAYGWMMAGLFVLNMIFIFAGVDLTITYILWLFLAASFILGIILFHYYSKKM
ncbi:hypothetical protein MmiAt1_05460 [Methanimicrococcus sp. At1]|uniref:DUF2178 domain-containing protein n=1 Tax=Methanimicrococcus hacksteinii TaxID=3028293 RepID=A0ABU3VNK4_9EURY|nr:hypothetical protein [Methanimicrococcus sp. At1]MDV0444994.1 hypothetical protein [Methanimicrococcus sp. At1]